MKKLPWIVWSPVVLALGACGQPAPAVDSSTALPSGALMAQMIAPEGVITEGQGIGSVQLGQSRAQVEAVLGAPSQCTTTASAKWGTLPLCRWNHASGGRLEVVYRDATVRTVKKAPPTATEPTGVVNISVYTLPGYLTTRGVGTGQYSGAVYQTYGSAVFTYGNSAILPAQDQAGRTVHTRFSWPAYNNTVLRSIDVKYPDAP
ncbi:hypothetical protein ACFFLM_22450 [Deinococcus oregonensis]|uniref:Lipoprotein n=1 Tax=Deinococcus oregonensis TaxID=1805970 RepID=A0ABV6B4P0_9DEIO